MSCNSACGVTIPAVPAVACSSDTRAAGVSRIIVASCEIVFNSLSDLEEWADFITANKIHASGMVLGQKPKGSYTKQKLASCKPEQVTGGTHTITFKDYNSDLEDGADYDFWKFVQDNQNNLKFGYIDCNDNFYGFIENFSADIDDVRGENSEEAMYFDGTLTWLSKTIVKPINIPGLNAILA